MQRHGATNLICDQVEYHPFLAQRAVLDRVRAHGMMLTAYCPLGQGRLASSRELAAIAERYGRFGTAEMDRLFAGGTLPAATEASLEEIEDRVLAAIATRLR